MTRWQRASGLDPEAAEAFRSLDAVFALEGDIVASDPMSQVTRVTVGATHYYVKCYFGLGKKPLRRLLATPRVQAEWQNLQHFADWGIPTARLVAHGLEREGGRFVRGALVTAEIPDTTDLAQIARRGDARLKSRRWRDGISTQLADIARRMHQQGFAHGDFKWRNLLVDASGKVFLIDCPSGGFWWRPFLEYRIIKDLACLDKLGRRHLTRTQRLRFYLDYVQKRHLDANDKTRIRRIVAFFAGRDEDLSTAASLRAPGRKPTRSPLAPCTVDLGDRSLLAIERWLRILPGKRLTGIARWRGRPVIAKLFIAARGSKRHWQRECRGAETLQAHALPTPALLARGTLAGGGHYVLYDYLPAARSPDPDAVDDLSRVFEQAGRLHAMGLLQEDAHFGNFLIDGERLLFIDGDAIRGAASPGECMANLALLFAQLSPAAEEDMRPVLLAAYRRGHPAAGDGPGLATATERARQLRLADYLDKSLRDCSLFKVAKRVDRFFSVLREESGFLAPLLHDPDAWMEKGTPLKRGNSATLVHIELDARPLVIKRYNIKSAGHALSRCWRQSRAWHSWLAGHRLDFLGIATPRPLGLIERRFGPLRGKAWLITEHCPGTHLSDLLAAHVEAPPEEVIAAMATLFRQLAAARITHGDLKATNLLWYAGRIVLVDLDATRQHDSPATFAKAWRKDRERLLRNWPESSALRQILDRRLPAP